MQNLFFLVAFQVEILRGFVEHRARGSVVVKALRYKPEGLLFQPNEVNDFLQFS
jgi:hypothetical protein